MSDNPENVDFFFVSLGREPGGLLDLLQLPASADEMVVQTKIGDYRKDLESTFKGKRKELREPLKNGGITQEQFDEQVKTWQQEWDDKLAAFNQLKEAFDLKIAEQRRLATEGLVDDTMIWFPMLESLKANPGALWRLLWRVGPTPYFQDNSRLVQLTEDPHTFIFADARTLATRALIERIFAGASDPNYVIADGGLLYEMLLDSDGRVEGLIADTQNKKDIGVEVPPRVEQHALLELLELPPSSSVVAIDAAISNFRKKLSLDFKQNRTALHQSLKSHEITQKQFDDQEVGLQQAWDAKLELLNRLKASCDLDMREAAQSGQGPQPAVEDPIASQSQKDSDAFLQLLQLPLNVNEMTVDAAVREFVKKFEHEFIQEWKGIHKSFTSGEITQVEYDGLLKIWEQQRDDRWERFSHLKQAYDTETARPHHGEVSAVRPPPIVENPIGEVKQFLLENPEVFWRAVQRIREHPDLPHWNDKRKSHATRPQTAFRLRHGIEDRQTAELIAADLLWLNVKYTNRDHWLYRIADWIDEIKKLGILWSKSPQAPEDSVDPLQYRFSHYIDKLTLEAIPDIPTIPIGAEGVAEFQQSRVNPAGQQQSAEDMEQRVANMKAFFEMLGNRAKQANKGNEDTSNEELINSLIEALFGNKKDEG